MRHATAIAFVLAATIAACQGGNGPSGSSQGEASGAIPTHLAATVGSPPSPTPDDAAPPVLDAALLDYLPETVEGVSVTEALDEAALALADPALPRIASALDVGLAIDETRRNFVAAHVVRLREGAFDHETYRQWRDSYDEGACAAAQGVLGRSEVTIDERTVHVTSCVAGLRTYHLWIEDEHLLISASSVGEGRFGEQLMSELRVD